MQLLRQSTQADVVIGPVWATADGALKSDLAHNAAGINCDLYAGATKSDVTLANAAGAGYFRPGSGEAQYLLTLSATHTATVGRLRLTLSATGFYMRPEEYFVLPANVYDALVGTDYLQTDTMQIEGSDATNQITASVPSAASTALGVLLHDWEAIVATVPDRCALQALRVLRNAWSSSGGTLTVCKEDDDPTDPAWTATLVGDSGANPVTSLTPAP